MAVPDLKSGVYAARLRAGEAEEHVVFFLRPKEPTAPIAMLIPTCSYLAYANERIGLGTGIAQVLSSQVTVIHEWDVELQRRPEYGASCYDSHRDGAGICYTTRLRPIFNMRPRHRTAPVVVPWQFPADLSIIYWLETMGYDYDVITDEDLHQEGLDCLSPYNVVINATHAEYYSEAMMDATEDYLASGRAAHVPLRQRLLLGRLLPRGRHGRDGGAPARLGHQSLERRPRRALHGEQWGARRSLAGARAGAAKNPRHRVHLRGHGRIQTLPQDAGCREPWPPPGSSMGSRATPSAKRGLASAARPASSSTVTTWHSAPRRTRCSLASSEGHSDNFPLVVEDILCAYPGVGGTQDHRIRADMTYFTTPNDGAVWSASSIAWGQALPINECDNSASKVTANVLNAFLKDGPLPGSGEE